VPPEDRDDVEQEIVISLIGTLEKYGNKGENYLKAVARSRLYEYLRKKYKEREGLRFIFQSEKEEMVRGMWKFLHDDDARLDAKATLATLPTRLIQIGYKILNEEKLSEADQHYWVRQKSKLRPKLNCRRYANRLSDWEKRRILHLHSEGASICKIARTLGRSNRAVMRVLAGSQPLTRDKWLAKMEMAAKERDELIRHAYFVDGKSITGIEREFHHGFQTVRTAIAGQHF
jgi:DNA-directed RNA polymerase specialized sigma24 family protein